MKKPSTRPSREQPPYHKDEFGTPIVPQRPLPGHILVRASSPSAPSVDEPKNYQKQYCADSSVDNGGDDAGPKMNAQLRQQPIADEGADDPNDDIGEETEAGALHDLSGKPSSDEANH